MQFLVLAALDSSLLYFLRIPVWTLLAGYTLGGGLSQYWEVPYVTRKEGAGFLMYRRIIECFVLEGAFRGPIPLQ